MPGTGGPRTGRGGIGFNPQGQLVSKYGILPLGQATEMMQSLIESSNAMVQLAKSLRRAEGAILSLGDPKAQVAAGALGQSAGQAMNTAQELVNSATNIDSELTNVLNEVGGISTAGAFSLGFNGTANQEVTKTISDSHITTNGIGYCWYAPPSYDTYTTSFYAWTDTLSAGSITFKIRNVGAAPSNNYPFQYLIFFG